MLHRLAWAELIIGLRRLLATVAESASPWHGMRAAITSSFPRFDRDSDRSVFFTTGATSGYSRAPTVIARWKQDRELTRVLCCC